MLAFLILGTFKHFLSISLLGLSLNYVINFIEINCMHFVYYYFKS